MFSTTTVGGVLAEQERIIIIVLDVYKLCFSRVVLKVTTTFSEYDTKRRGRKQRKRSERTNGPQNKGRREFFKS